MPETAARVTRLMGLLQDRPTLIVVDGVERWLRGWNSGAQDRQAADTVEERIAYFPGLDEFLEQAAGLNNGSHVILTSRALPASLDDAERAVVPVRDPEERDLSLEGLDPDSSVALLQSLGVKGDSEELKHVAENYAHHPLGG